MSAVSPRRKDELTRGSVRGRTALAMLLSAALLIPVIVLCVFYINQLDRTARGIVNQDVELIRTGDRISLTFLRAQQHEAAFARSGDSTSLLAARLDFELVDSLCRLGAALGPELAARFDTIRARSLTFQLLKEKAYLTPEIRSIQSAVTVEADSIIAFAIRRTGRSQERAARLAAWGQRNILTALLVVIVALVWLIIALPARIVLPVKRIANALNRAEQGEFDVRVNAGTSDELGRLAHQINRVFARLREVDERKVDRILLLERRFKLLAADIAEGVLVFDRISNLVFANAASEPLVGQPPTEATGRSLNDFPQLEFLREPLENTLAGAAAHQECGILPGLPGSAVCLEALRDSTGSVIAALVVITNPTAPEPTSSEEPPENPT